VNKKEREEKIKNAPSCSLEELAQMGLVDKYEHLRDHVDFKMEKVSYINSAGFFPIGRELASFVNKLIQDSNLEFVSDTDDLFEVSKMLRNQVSVIDNALSDELAEELTEASKELTEYIDLIEFWKTVSILTPLVEEVERIEFSISENISSKFTNLVSTSLDTLSIVKKGLAYIKLSDESSSEDIHKAIDLLFACFYLGVEMSIGYVNNEGEWCPVGDEEALKQWITGFGNPYEYDNSVGDVVSKVFDECPDIKDDFYENFYLLLKSIYDIDVDDYLNEVESVDWDLVFKEFQLLL